MLVRAVIFDLDGVLIDSELVWERVRRDYTLENGGAWGPDSQQRMMGLSTPEWSRFMADGLGVAKKPHVISNEVIERMAAVYVNRLPLLPGATDVARELAGRRPLGLASSSPRLLIDTVLEATGLAGEFTATRSTEEEDRGKPSPDVYQTVARLLAVVPEECVAVEDSTSGLRSAASAKMTVVAIPRPAFPPSSDALRLAARVLPGLRALPATVEELAQEAAGSGAG